ncbi:MAG: phenylalanine--tRNA ligase subunit beta [Candidatus Bilamarchaeaceae archaeon]
MVVVEIDYDDFKDMFRLDKAKVVSGLTEIGAPTEVDEETGKLFVEVTPNRPDWYSVVGLARALQAYYKERVKRYKAEKSNYKIVVDKKVSKIRPYTVGAVVKGLEFNDVSIRDAVLLQEKLLATLGRRVKRFGIGIYPLEKLKFPVRYTAMKPEEIVYKPLNYPKVADANEILREHPKGMEYGHIIKNAKEYPVYLDADGNIMALIPIVNSEDSGRVDRATKDIFIEVTGVDVVGINQALNILVCHFVDLGGRAYSVEVEYEDRKIRSPELNYTKLDIDEKEVERVLGVRIEKNEIKKALLRMGYAVESNYVATQPYRADILGFIDVIEDIAIVYGYNNFEPTVPDFFYPGKKIVKYRKINDIMQRMGFVEISTPVLTNKNILEVFGQKGLEVLNPKTIEYTTIRPSLIPSVMEVLVKNKMRGLPQRIYEVGRALCVNEKTMLCFAYVDKDVDFPIMRGYIQTLCKEMGWAFALESAPIEFFEQPYSANIVLNKKIKGVVGKINKETMAALDILFPTYICQLELSD